ncbi:MAG TPA: 1-acyl-sn-glycerol-3-phosphate acyltransferase [Streptosporangiaceae bacterium]|nr:1-acyl-sn-glycerol-3-phosphate acyltransferase [Streptosporangiaceae bacterium]
MARRESMAGKKTRRAADGSYSDAWRTVSKIILRPGIRMMMRLDWRGQENLPADGPVILAANHLSYMDIFAVSLFADSARRYPVFLAKSSLFAIPVLGTILGRLGQLPVYRGQVDAALVLKQAAELAARNNACVIFYPESTVTRDPDQWPMVAKTGVARLALERNIPVVPIAHWGAQRILPYGKFVPKFLPRKTVQIAAGPPVDLAEFTDQPMTNAVLRAATNKIMTEVAALLGGLRGQTPPAEVYHPAVARRKLRQELRALQEASDHDAAGADSTATGSTATGSTAADTTAGDATAAGGTATDSTATSASTVDASASNAPPAHSTATDATATDSTATGTAAS